MTAKRSESPWRNGRCMVWMVCKRPGKTTSGSVQDGAGVDVEGRHLPLPMKGHGS